MTSCNLFDMELKWGEGKNEIEIVALSLFEEMEKELGVLIRTTS